MLRLHNENQDRLNEVAESYFGPVSLTAGIVMFLYTFFNAIGSTPDSNPLMLIHDALIGVMALIFAFLGFTHKVPYRFIHPLLGVVILSIALSILHSLYLSPRPIHSVLLMLLVLVTGNFFLSMRWALSIISISAAGWFAVGLICFERSDFADYALAMTGVIITTVMIIHNRIGRNMRLITLHHKDREARERLSESIEETRREIDERRKAELEQRRLENQLRQAQKLEAVGRLAGGVAHDINNMLAAISGTAEALMRDCSNEQLVSEDLDSILAACNRGKVLTSNLLGFAQKGKYRREQIDLNEMIRDVKTFMSRTIPEHIWFETFLCKDLPPIEGDPGQINQVLVNLINNAVDAMEVDGHLIITTELVDEIERQGVTGLESASGTYIKIIVSDTGRGMKEGTIERAFEPFFSTKKTGEGTGLGLSMVYGTITNHGGAVLIRSAVNQGTAVTVYLPEYTRSTLRVASEHQPRFSAPAQHGLVLLVDDEPLVRRSGKRILEQMGYSVVEAAGGEEALEKYADSTIPVDVVLLDLIMPGMEGDEVFRRLKEIDSEVKVIFVSAYSRETMRVDNLLADGALDFVQKPFSVNDIDLAIATAIGIPGKTESSQRTF
ncbi:MAG: response regulator [Deltaproteobacteria bacterium]|nr:response regulator [Deltaproteobacteria bacterium]